MLHQGAGNIGGNMSDEMRMKAKALLDQFVEAVSAISDERHLQRGIARALLPCSAAVILDRESLFVIATFNPENRSVFYVDNPDMAFTPNKVLNSAVWEFGFENPFLVQFPRVLLDMPPEDREADVRRIAGEHVDSEVMRFISLMSLMRTRPIFGSAPVQIQGDSVYLLAPPGEIYDAVSCVVGGMGLHLNPWEDIRSGRAAVKEMWVSINEARVIVADLMGPDPGVMYGLGIAHTLGKETVLVRPPGSIYLADIPRVHGIDYDEGGVAEMKRILEETLRSIVEPLSPSF